MILDPYMTKEDLDILVPAILADEADGIDSSLYYYATREMADRLYESGVGIVKMLLCSECEDLHVGFFDTRSNRQILVVDNPVKETEKEDSNA